MWDLPYAARCMAINIYCFSKILFYDRFVPAPSAFVDDIQQAAFAACWAHRNHHLVSEARLLTPVDHGGFGLFDLALQLRIGRAKWAFQLLKSEALRATHSHVVRLRLKIAAEPFAGEPVSTSQIRNTTGNFTITWPWYGALTAPPPPLVIFNAAQDRTLHTLPLRWRVYMQSWTQMIQQPRGARNFPEICHDWAIQYIRRPVVPWNSAVPMDWFEIPGLGELTDLTFGCKPTANFHEVKYPPIDPPKGHQKLGLDKDQWDRWWPTLRPVRRRDSEVENTLHLLSLYALHPGCQVGRPAHTKCILCLSDDEETLEHLFVDCAVAKQVWAANNSSAHPSFSDFVCPMVYKGMTNQLVKRATFVHYIWKLSRSRRYPQRPVSLLKGPEIASLILHIRARARGAC